jgi:hypothetical protein
MKNIKKEIYKACVAYDNKYDLDILPEELASMALYKILNQGYFKNKFNYLRLYRNEYGEIILVSNDLKGIKPYSNGNVDSRVILFDNDNTVSLNPPEYFDLLFKDKEIEIINSVIKAYEKENFEETFRELIEINKNNYNDLNNIFKYLGKFDKDYNSINYSELIIKQLNEHLSPEQINEMVLKEKKSDIDFTDEYQFTIKKVLSKKYKINEKTVQALLKNIINTESKSNGNIYKEEEFNGNEDNYLKFRKNLIEYKNSLLYILENKNIKTKEELIIQSLSDYPKYIVINNLKKVKSNEIEENIFNKYELHINKILNNFYKKNPNFLLDDKNFNSNIQISFNNSTKDVIQKFKYINLYETPNTEIYNTAVINGISFLGYIDRKDNDINYIEINNGIESIGLGEVKIKNEISYNKKFDNVKVLNLFDLSTLKNFEEKIISKENIINIFKEINNKYSNEFKKIVIAHEFIDVISYTDLEMKEMAKILKEVEKEFKDLPIVFCGRHNEDAGLTISLRYLKENIVKLWDEDKITKKEVGKYFTILNNLSNEEIEAIEKNVKDNLVNYLEEKFNKKTNKMKMV